MPCCQVPLHSSGEITAVVEGDEAKPDLLVGRLPGTASESGSRERDHAPAQRERQTQPTFRGRRPQHGEVNPLGFGIRVRE